MYNGFYGLKEAPFSISPNPKYFYLSAHHREALSMLKRGVTQSGGFVLFTGEVGTGKTVIVRTIINEIPENVDKVVIFNPDLSTIELLEEICQGLKIPVEPESSKRVLIDQISTFLKNNYVKGRRAIVLIDEAQHLSDEAIEQVRLLTNIETDNEKLLQVILVGQPELQDKLRQQHMRQVAQRITSRFHLLPLSVEEVDSYVRFRLQAAGCVQIIFSRGAINALYRASSGIPRVINVIADRALELGTSDKSPRIETKHVVKATHEMLGTKSTMMGVADLIRGLPNMLTIALYGILTLLLVTVGYFAGRYYYAQPTRIPRAQMVKILKADPDIMELSSRYQQLKKMVADTVDERREQSRYISDVSASELEEDAYQNLRQVWGFAPQPNIEIESDCNVIRNNGFRCQTGRTSLDELERYNVPVILQLLDNKLQPFYAVLLNLNQEHAVLLMNGREWVVKREFVQKSMEGYFRLIWPLPNGSETVTSRSDKLTQELFVEMLNAYDGKGSEFTYWNQSLVERIRKVQRDFKLRVDGKVGSDTLWVLLPYATTEHPLYHEHIVDPQVVAKQEQQKATVIPPSSDLNLDDFVSDEPKDSKAKEAKEEKEPEEQEPQEDSALEESEQVADEEMADVNDFDSAELEDNKE